MLHQNFMAEMFVGSEPEASFTPDGRFVVKFPACWSRDAEEKIWFDCVAWGNITTSDKPTAKELGAFACFVSELEHTQSTRSRIGVLSMIEAGVTSALKMMRAFPPSRT